MGRPRRRPGVSRRDLLRGAAGALAITPWLTACGGGSGSGASGDEARATARAPGSGAMFSHGVASGDPLADRVILWTHVTPPDSGPMPVDWQIATDASFDDIIAQGSTLAEPARDHTVKVDPTGLTPDTVSFYRFIAAGNRSATGRTRTLPAGPTERVRLAAVSCASLPHGFFNAYRRIAERDDLNAVVHLGDYIYEYGNDPGQYGADVQAGGRTFEPAHETLSLDDYRTRHACYKLDPDLQALHASHPMIAIWDDHETANNAFVDGAENHDPATEGDWPLRRDAGLRAYYEWMPIRVTDPTDRRVAYRQFRFGDLVELSMLETRLLARSEPAGQADAGDINDPARQLLGNTQFDWLRAGLQDSRTRWRLLGQQVMMGQLRLAGLPELMQLPVPELDRLLGQVPLVGTGGVLLNPDQWDGYRAARQRLFDLFANTGNVVVLTGDIHTSWAMDLQPDPFPITGSLFGGPPVGVEFVVPSVTSPGLPQLQPARQLIRVNNPHIRYVDLAEHGYVIVDVDAQRVEAQWWYVDDILGPSNGERLGATMRTESGANRLTAG
ncbi:alkaline phosphatase D family protein [Salinisphaera sp. P385]|uniref:Alkaline phosphatase D family protein n=1 Tax=Spectribacter acetivorans TaxID=3075603 RepID=A0ABU3B6T0_9GAMM|nr:alkaline phosphatase D family protein [Salinisphaera sp. P385]MDT0618160.1 alkaline phosphatase D family protein [Salinisphaera sp. P385]